MGQSVLDLLAKDLDVVSVSNQEIRVGGYDYSVTLPSVIITPSNPIPSWDWGASWSQGIGNSYDSSYGGGGGSAGPGIGNGNGNSNGNGEQRPSNVSDPNNLLGGTKGFLDSTVEVLKDLIDKGVAPEGSEDYLKTLENARDTLEKMENSSDQKYRIEEIPNNGDNLLDAEISYDSKTGEVVLGIENISGVNNYSLVIHELTHIEQLMSGELWVENGTISGYDIHDEVEAYQNQHDSFYGSQSGYYDLDGNPYPDGDYKVTPEDIYDKYPGVYNNLPDHNWSKPSGNSGGNFGGSASSYQSVSSAS